MSSSPSPLPCPFRHNVPITQTFVPRSTYYTVAFLPSTGFITVQWKQKAMQFIEEFVDLLNISCFFCDLYVENPLTSSSSPWLALIVWDDLLEGQNHIWWSFLRLCPVLQVSLKLIGRVNKHASWFPPHTRKQITVPFRTVLVLFPQVFPYLPLSIGILDKFIITSQSVNFSSFHCPC